MEQNHAKVLKDHIYGVKIEYNMLIALCSMYFFSTAAPLSSQSITNTLISDKVKAGLQQGSSLLTCTRD